MTAIILRGDARRLPLPDACVDLIVTSPPYFGLRSYTDGGEHYDGQIGSEATPAEFVAALLDCTREWVRVLKPSGSLFVNLGDKYASGNGGDSHLTELGHRLGSGGGQKSDKSKLRQKPIPGLPPKTLLGLPWRLALACTDQLGLILRRDIIWAKPNGLPESVTDRCRSSHEYVFHLTRQPRYYAAVDEIREPGRPGTQGDHVGEDRKAAGHPMRYGEQTISSGAGIAPHPLGKLPGSVWNIPSQPLTVPPALGVDHFAAFPSELPRRCVLGWSPGGVCVACGEGRRPVVAAEQEHIHTQRRTVAASRIMAQPNGEGAGSGQWDMITRFSDGRAVRETAISGYACACPTPDAATRPAIVLDPFGGTGTPALVASVYGRTGISIDHSADYNRIAAWRTQDPAERCRVIGAPKPPPVLDGQDALFDLAGDTT